MKMRILLHLVVCCLCLLLVSCAHKPLIKTNYDLKFGLLDRETKKLVKETTTFQKMHDGADSVLGFVVTSMDCSDFSTHTLIEAPKPAVRGPQTVYRNSNRTRLSGHRLRSQDGVVRDTYYFHENDPVGGWSMEIFINNQQFKKIPLTVVNEQTPTAN